MHVQHFHFGDETCAAALQQRNNAIAAEVQSEQNSDDQLKETSLHVEQLQAQNASLKQQLSDEVTGQASNDLLPLSSAHLQLSLALLPCC